LDRRRGHEGWRGDHRPDPAPFPADDGTPPRLRTISIAGSCALKTVRGEGTGGERRGSATAIGPRTTGREITASPPTVGHRWTIGRCRGGWARETAGSVRVSGAVVHLSKCRHAAQRRDAIADRMPGMGDQRPTVGHGRTMAVDTFDVCSNAAVNSGLSCFLYAL